MVARAFQRGQPIVFHNQWEYLDGVPITVERACSRCERMPVNGHDACLGTIPGVTSACCGHGKESSFSFDKSSECGILVV